MREETAGLLAQSGGRWFHNLRLRGMPTWIISGDLHTLAYSIGDGLFLGPSLQQVSLSLVGPNGGTFLGFFSEAHADILGISS